MWLADFIPLLQMFSSAKLQHRQHSSNIARRAVFSVSILLLHFTGLFLTLFLSCSEAGHNISPKGYYILADRQYENGEKEHLSELNREELHYYELLWQHTEATVGEPVSLSKLPTELDVYFMKPVYEAEKPWHKFVDFVNDLMTEFGFFMDDQPIIVCLKDGREIRVETGLITLKTEDVVKKGLSKLLI